MLVNLIAVAIATVIQQFVAMMYYGPIMGSQFKKHFMKGKDPNPNFDFAGAFTRSVIGAFMANLCMSYVMYNTPIGGKILHKELNVDSAFAVFAFGQLFTLLVAGMDLLHSGWLEQTIPMWLITQGYHILSFGTSAVVLHFASNYFK